MRIMCPLAPEEWSGAEGCGEWFIGEPDDEGDCECPSCGLAFDINRTVTETV